MDSDEDCLPSLLDTKITATPFYNSQTTTPYWLTVLREGLNSYYLPQYEIGEQRPLRGYLLRRPFRDRKCLHSSGWRETNRMSIKRKRNSNSVFQSRGKTINSNGKSYSVFQCRRKTKHN